MKTKKLIALILLLILCYVPNVYSPKFGVSKNRNFEAKKLFKIQKLKRKIKKFKEKIK
jgi:hypothetical protein